MSTPRVKDSATRISRRGVVAGAATLAGSLAAACAAPGSPSPTQSAKPVKISWAIYNGQTLLDAQQEGGALYRQKNPNVTIEYVPFADQQENITPWLGGSGPHIAMNWGTPMVDTARQGMYTILDSYIKRDGKAIPLDDYVEYQLKAQQVQGVGRYGLPVYLNVYVLLYNKQLFQRKGVALPDDNWDWTKYADAGVKLTEPAKPDDLGGVGVFGGLNVGERLGSTKVFQNAGEMVNPADDRKTAFNNPAGLEALQWMHDRLWKDRSWAQSTAVTAGGFKDRFAMLIGGKLATVENMASSAIGDVVKGNPAAVGVWDIAPWPRGKQRASRASIDAWTIWKGASDQDDVWTFMKFLQSPEWLDIQARKAGYQHPRISMQDRYLDVLKQGLPQIADKNLHALVHPVKNRYARPDAIFRKDADAWKIWLEAWNSAMVKNEQTVSSAFGDAARRIDAAM